jgi:nitrous oxide reductase accessory protein NosL
MFDSGAATYDYAAEAEVPVEKAFFVLRTDVRTPQGYGIVAFRDRAAAEAFSADHGRGRVVKWFELVDEKLK